MKKSKEPPRPVRGQSSWVSTAVDLPRLLAEAEGLAWVSPATRAAFAGALALLEADLAGVLGRLPIRDAAAALRISTSRLVDHRAAGWLAGRWRSDLTDRP